MGNLDKIIERKDSVSLLYIEDNTFTNEQSVKFFKNFFSDITSVDNAEDGLKEYLEYYNKHNKYHDLIITDIKLPNMDGITLCKKIFQLHPEQEIIVISAYDDSHKLQRIIDLGIANYLQKPITYDKFIEKLSKVYDSQNVKQQREKNLKEIKELNEELDSMINSFDKYVIASRTDTKGIITYASKAYCTISGYSNEELVGQPHNIVRHPDMPKEAFEDLWATIKDGRVWHGEVKNLKKGGGFYWVNATVGPYYNKKNKLIGYSAIREDITAKKEVEGLHKQVNDLLNNTGQGFLSFDENYTILDGYSNECIQIFKEKIEGKNLSQLLFSNNQSMQELFEYGITNILNEKDPLAKDLFLSLLPKSHILFERDLDLDFKILEDKKFMLILTDITENNKLQKKIVFQQKVQKMVVQVVSNKSEFMELKNSFNDFINNLDELFDEEKEERYYIKIVKNELHTFKGLFAQKECIYIVDAIHDVETQIINLMSQNIYSINKIKTTLLEANLLKELEKDIKLLNSILEEDYFKKNNSYELQERFIDSLENEVLSLSKYIAHEGRESYSKLLTKISAITEQSLKDLFSSYPAMVLKISKKLQKPIHPFEIETYNIEYLSGEFKPFIKSLVHIFRNSIIHGIEERSIRQKRGKENIGTISCKVTQENGFLTIVITDDGGGIDIEKIKEKALKLELYSSKELETYSEDKVAQIIFHDAFSTANDVTQLAGRGVGLSAVKDEVDKLKGEIIIENKPLQGVSFVFKIPLVDPLTSEIEKDIFCKHLHRQLFWSIENFLSNDMQLDIVKSENLNNKLEIKKYAAHIYIEGYFQGDVLFLFDKKLIEKLALIFIPQGFSDEESRNMRDNIPSEIANIVVGLIVQNLPNGGEDIKISPPFVLKKNELKEYEDVDYINGTKIETGFGNLVYALVDNIKRR